MNSLARMRACVNGEPFDQYPFVITYPLWSLMPHLPRLVGLTHLHVHYGSDEERIRCHAVPHDRLGLDWAPLPVGPLRRERGRYQIERDGDVPLLVDTVANTRERVAAFPEVHQADDPVLTSATEAEQLPPPQTADRLLDSGYFDLTAEFVKRYGRTVFLFTTMSGPFSYCYEMLGFELLMDALSANPRLLHRLLERRTEEIIQQARALSRVGAHGMRVWEIFCGADILSETAFRTFVFPYNQRICRAIRHHGMVAIFEMMGWVEPRLPQLARLGMNCLQSDCTLKNQRNDVGEYRRVLGEEVCILGNVHAIDVIEKGDENVWRRAMTEQARGVGQQRRYCICNGTPTTWATSPARLIGFGNCARQALARAAPLADRPGQPAEGVCPSRQETE